MRSVWWTLCRSKQLDTDVRDELGIRSALGAQPRHLLLGIFGRAMRQLGIGVLGGSVSSLAVVVAAGIGPAPAIALSADGRGGHDRGRVACGYRSGAAESPDPDNRGAANGSAATSADSV